MRSILTAILNIIGLLSFSQSGINAAQDEKGILVTNSGKPVFYYHIAEAVPPADSSALYRRSGFIHPLYSPAGKVLTDDFPAGHAHQHAIFMAWASTSFKGVSVDFWNQQSNKGTVKHEQLIAIKRGKNQVEIKTRLAHISLEHGKVLDEIWTLKVYQLHKTLVIELQSDQLNITKDTLHLKKYHYGGLAFRGSAEWNDHDKKFSNRWRLLTSEGKDTSTANATYASWVDASGLVENMPAGVTIFSHPSNFRHPQPLRVHPQMPYWAFSPMVEKAFFIAPGQHYKSRFLIVPHDGFADQEKSKAIFDSWLGKK